MLRKHGAREETRQMQRMHFRAAFDAATFNEQERTVEVVWTTGAKGIRRSYGWDSVTEWYEELSLETGHVRMERLNNGAPFLNSHRSWGIESVLGVIERAWIVNAKEGRALVRFSERDEVAPIMKDIKARILQNISVGYDVRKYERIRSAEKDVPDTYRAVDWEPMEISIVPIGFDDGAKVRGQGGENPLPMHSVQIITRGEAALSEEVHRPMETEAEKAARLEREAAARRTADAAAATAATAAERERVKEIRSIVRKAGLDLVAGDALINECVDGGLTLDAVRAKVIDVMAARQQTEQGSTRTQHGIEVGEMDSEKWQRGAHNWLVRKAAVGSYFKDVAGMDPGEFRGMTLVDLARESLARDGVKVRGLDKMDLVGKALTYRSSYNGTSDFSVLLENTMHKVLLGAFAIAPDTWRRWCAIGSVSDFRAHNRYRLGTFGTLDRLNELGEFKSKQIPDGSKELISAITKGNIIGLSRQAIINDDMGAFNSLATSFGRMAGLSIEVDAYTAVTSNSGLGPLLADGNPVFHARTGANNIVTGAALSADALDQDRQAMAQIKDISGNEYLDLRPAVLLVPLTLGAKGREINAMEFNEESGKTNKRPNSVRGLFRDIVDTPRLSGTRRYLFADPSVAPVVEVAFLDGQQTPVLENKEGWRVDGVEWKVRVDYGVAGVGHQGAVTNAGA
jgi:hypothetical protein